MSGAHNPGGRCDKCEGFCLETAIVDGGPAFPATEANGANSGVTGMTMRDYFAAKAMQGLLARSFTKNEKDRPFIEWVGALSFEVADAMLKARQS